MSVETKLFDLGEWSIRSVQILGYLPLSVVRSSTETWLTFRIRSGPVAATLILLTISIGWELNYFYNLKVYSKFIAIFGSTEKYANNFFVIVTCIVGIIFRITALTGGSQTLGFWQENCKTLEKIQVTLGYTNLVFLEREEFSRIKGTLKWSVLMIATSVVIHSSTVHGHRLLRSVLDETVWAVDSELYVGSGLWSILVLLHVLNAKWGSFFIRIYTASFNCLAERIRNLKEISEIPGVIYLSEIFSSKKCPRVTLTQFETQLTRCIDAFTILEYQVARFNELVGGKLIIEMLLCITNLVVHSFFASLWLGRGGYLQMAQLIVPFSMFANQLYCLGTVSGEMTIAARMVAAAIFENISFQNLTVETRVKLQMLVTKIENGPPVISARYFFVVNRHLVTSVLSAMTTFLVVLVQFRDADETA